MICWKKTAAVVAVSICAVLACSASATAEGLLERPAAAPADPGATRGVVFTGYDYMKGSNYEFVGTIIAMNGDLGKDGFAFRAYGAHLDYDLTPGDGRGWQGDLMLGYVFNRRDYSAGVFVGVDYQNFKLSPDDPTAVVRGIDWGVKVAANVTTSNDLPYFFDLNAAYTGAFSSYWARARAGMNHHGMTFGPEAIVMGSEGFDAHRLGGFLSFKIDRVTDKPIEVTVAAGHHFLSGSGPVSGASSSEGTYANITLAFGF